MRSKPLSLTIGELREALGFTHRCGPDCAATATVTFTGDEWKRISAVLDAAKAYRRRYYATDADLIAAVDALEESR